MRHSRSAFLLVGLAVLVALVALLPAAGPRPAAPASSSLLNNLVAYWTMDEAAGAIRNDSGTNNLDLADFNTVGQATGKLGNAASLSSSGTAYLGHSDGTELSPGNSDFSIALWVYLNSKPAAVWGQDSATIIGKWGSGNQREYSLVYRGVTVPEYGTVANTFEFGITDDGIDPSGATRVGSTNLGGVSTGTWYFVVAWHDSISDTLNIQVNNGIPNSITHTTGIYNSTSAFELGRNEANLTEWSNALRMDGRIDELGLWSRVLTDDERTALYNNGDGLTYPFGPITPSDTPTVTSTATETRTATPTVTGTLPTDTATPTTTQTATQTTTSTPTTTKTSTTTPTATKTAVPPVNIPIAIGKPLPTWVTVKQENFEGDFPNDWEVVDLGSGAGSYLWGKRNCVAADGANSGWAVGGGAGAGLACGSHYPDNVESWMIYGPFDLAGASAADFQLKLNLYAELNFDGMCYLASTNNIDFYGTCLTGNSGGWIDRTLDLAAVPTLGDLRGANQVWVAVLFISDESFNFTGGVYVDSLLVRECLYGVCASSEAVAEPLLASAEEHDFRTHR